MGTARAKTRIQFADFPFLHFSLVKDHRRRKVIAALADGLGDDEPKT